MLCHLQKLPVAYCFFHRRGSAEKGSFAESPHILCDLRGSAVILSSLSIFGLPFPISLHLTRFGSRIPISSGQDEKGSQSKSDAIPVAVRPVSRK